MLSSIVIFSLFAYTLYKGLINPWMGIIGFYAFLCLDPAWNWRWALPTGFRFQFYIFIVTFVGYLLVDRGTAKFSTTSKVGLISGIILFSLLKISEAGSIAPEISSTWMAVYWKTQVILLLLVRLIDTPRKVAALLIFPALGLAYNAYQINLEYFQLGYCRYARMSYWGSYGLDNNTLSISFLPGLSIAIAFLFGHSNFRYRLTAFVGMALLGHLLMMLESRGTWLGALTTGIALLLFFPKNKSNMTLLLVVATLIAALAGPPVIKEWNSIFADAEEQDESALSRYELWKAGWEITNDYPWSGVGPNAARTIVRNYTNFDKGNKALHNLFFDYSSSGGFPALFFYLLLALPPWIYCLVAYGRARARDPLFVAKISVLTGLPGFWVASCFSSAPLLETSWLLIGVGYCVSNIELSNQTSGSFAPTRQSIEFIASPPLRTEKFETAIDG